MKLAFKLYGSMYPVIGIIALIGLRKFAIVEIPLLNQSLFIGIEKVGFNQIGSIFLMTSCPNTASVFKSSNSLSITSTQNLFEVVLIIFSGNSDPLINAYHKSKLLGKTVHWLLDFMYLFNKLNFRALSNKGKLFSFKPP